MIRRSLSRTLNTLFLSAIIATGIGSTVGCTKIEQGKPLDGNGRVTAKKHTTSTSYIKVGDIDWLTTTEGDTLNFGQTSTTIYVVGEWEAVGDAAGGFLAAAGGILIAICGGVILLIGLILALTLKTKDPVMMQQGQMMGGQMMAGQMPMQQMPAQQMPAQTTAQPYEYEQK